jgi:superfamily II DNA or RNA helicase
MQLYPDQVAGVAAIRSAYSMGHRSVLFVAPCAFGKTVLFGYIAQNAAKRGKSILIIAHRTELLDQISDTLKLFDIAHGFIAADRSRQSHQVMIASIQTLAKRVKYLKFSPDMVIVDEAHHCTRLNTFGKTLAEFPGAKILGVTATPCRLSGEGLGDVFDTMVLGPDTQHLIDCGRLSPFKLFAPPTVDVSGLHIRAGDFDKAETLALMDKPVITGSAVDHYVKHAAGRPFVAFCAGITHAQNVAAQFRGVGIEAVCIHGLMDATVRRNIVSDFRHGRIMGLCSVDLISEGFDVKNIVCGLMLRPTASRGLHIQQIGRCLRLAEGKTGAIIRASAVSGAIMAGASETSVAAIDRFAADIGLAFEAGLIRREDVTQFGDVLIGKADGRRSARDITLFDSSGLAIQDLAIAKLAYSKVGQLDGLQQIEL